jgi:hypothetical protein
MRKIRLDPSMAISKKSDTTKKPVKKTGLIYQDKSARGNKARREPWKEGLVEMDVELPVDLINRITTLAKKAGMGFEEFSGILLEQYARDRVIEMVEEQVLAVVLQDLADRHPDDYKRIEKELSKLPSPAKKVIRFIREIDPDIEKNVREDKLN